MKISYSALSTLAATALFSLLYVVPVQAGGPYTDNGDTVIENTTGLEWQKKTANTDGYGEITSFDKVTWQEAVTWCEYSVTEGQSDWRLPESPELVSLLDPTRPDHPYIDPIFESESARYWSNTTDTTNYKGFKNTVHFMGADGSVRGEPTTFQNYVRCVRDGNVPFPLSLTFSDRVGRVISDPSGMDCMDDCTQSFPAGTEVTLTAYDSHETAFSSWTNCPNPDGNVCTVTMNQARSIQANYISTLIPETVTVTAPVEGSSFHHGDQVTVQWTTDEAAADEYMIISMRRDAAFDMTAPDNESWYRFEGGDHSNDGSEVVTIPDSVLNANDWRFVVTHWASYGSGSSGAVSVSEGEDASSLYVDKLGTGSGTVISDDLKIKCGNGCSYQLGRFTTGETVTFTATSETCSSFTGWLPSPVDGSQGCDNVVGNQCTVAVDAYREVFPHFQASENEAAKIQVSFEDKPFEQGRVVSVPEGIDCSDGNGNCSAEFCRGDVVTLIVSPHKGAIFDGWYHPYDEFTIPCGTSTSCTITLPDFSYILPIPKFSYSGPHTLEVGFSGNGSGSVTSSPGGINCNKKESSTGCTKVFNPGEEITLTAVPGPNSFFSHWSGLDDEECDPNESTCTFAMQLPNHRLKAVFSALDADVLVYSEQDILEEKMVYSIRIDTNKTHSNASVLEISQSAAGLSGSPIEWNCLSTSKERCTKINSNQFNITLEKGWSNSLIGFGKYGADVNTATVTAVLHIEDAYIKNNKDSVVVHRDPASIPGVRTDTLLKYFGGKPSAPNNRNTLVLTHGWQPNPKKCAEMEKMERLNCLGEELWSGGSSNKGQASYLAMKNYGNYYSSEKPNLITERPNIIQYIWEGAFTQTGWEPRADEYIKARRGVFNAGKKLGKKLLDDLGKNVYGLSTYAGTIHFVGHSLGTAVNAYAIRFLLDHSLLKNNPTAKVQMTILDHPNRVDRIGIAGSRMTPDGEKRWGFDKDFFATVLPEINDQKHKDRLLVDNYFAEGIKKESGPATAGVGTQINGKNVYNHNVLHEDILTGWQIGLHDPNDIGQALFPDENTTVPIPVGSGLLWIKTKHYNDHSGVHQWYRWTMWSSREDYLTDDNFVCDSSINNHWHHIDGLPDHESLNPCKSGFAFSILKDVPLDLVNTQNESSSVSQAAKYDLEGGEVKGCTAKGLDTTPFSLPFSVVCADGLTEENSVAMSKGMAAEATEYIATDSEYAILDIDLSQNVTRLSFEYKLADAARDEDVFLLVDGAVVWSMNANSVNQREWIESGKIPVYIKRGEHKLMVAFNNTTTTSSFELQNLEFFQAPDDNKFPWTMFLPAILAGAQQDSEQVPTVTSATGRIWMDRNLGASRVATSMTDEAAYGDLYQWGRLADGHQKRTSGITTAISSSNTPNHDDFAKINSYPYDWRNPQNNNLWQGASGTNNPCPSGFRLPTISEWQTEIASWATQNSAGAFTSPLKFVMAGNRDFESGNIYSADTAGYYWSNTTSGTNSFFSKIANNTTTIASYRSLGLSIRCIKQ